MTTCLTEVGFHTVRSFRSCSQWERRKAGKSRALGAAAHLVPYQWTPPKRACRPRLSNSGAAKNLTSRPNYAPEQPGSAETLPTTEDSRPPKPLLRNTSSRRWGKKKQVNRGSLLGGEWFFVFLRNMNIMSRGTSLLRIRSEFFFFLRYPSEIKIPLPPHLSPPLENYPLPHLQCVRR